MTTQSLPNRTGLVILSAYDMYFVNVKIIITLVKEGMMNRTFAVLLKKLQFRPLILLLSMFLDKKHWLNPVPKFM